MAINTQKFLPSSEKNEIAKSSENFIVPINKIISSKSTRVNRPKKSKDQNDVKDKLVDVYKLLKSMFSDKKKADEKKRKEKEDTEFKQREDKLEAKKPKGINLPNPVKGVMGNIFDRILRFFLFTALGWLVPRIIKVLPALIKIAKILGSVYKFFEDIFGKLLDGFAGLLEFGFGVQDKIREGIKAIGGEGAAKAFDDFNGVLTTLVNTLLIAGMAFSSGITGVLGDLGKNSGCCCCPDPADLLDDVVEGGKRSLRFGLSSTRNVQKALRANPLFESKRWGRDLFNYNRLTGLAAEGVGNFGKSTQQAVVGGTGLKDILKTLNNTNEGKGVARFIKTALRSGWITPEQAIQIGERGRGFGQQTLRTAGTVGKNIFQNLGNIKDQAVSGIRSGIGAVREGAGRAVNAVRSRAIELGERFLAGGKELFSKVGNALNNINKWGESIGKGIKNIAEVAKNPNLLAEKAKDLISKSIKPQIEKNPLIKNIINMVKHPGEAVNAAGGLIKTALKNKEILSVADYLKKVRSTAKGSLGPIDKIIAIITALIDYGVLKRPFINAAFGAIGGLLGYTAGFAIGAPFGGAPGFITGAAGGLAGEFIGNKLAEALGSTPLAKVKDPVANDGRMLVQPTGDNAKEKPEETDQTPEDAKATPQGTSPETTQKTEEGGLILSDKQKVKKDVSADGVATRGGKEVAGELTRGGKEVGGKIKRTLGIAKKALQMPSIRRLSDPIVGRDVSGGEKSIIDLYGGNKTDDKKKNGYLALLNSAKLVKDVPFGIGNIMGSVIDMLLGQKPSEDATDGISQGIAYLINGVKSGTMIKDLMGNFFGFADGGEISQSSSPTSSPISSTPSEEQIKPETISKIIKNPFDTKIDEIYKVINEQSLRPNRSGSSSSTGSAPAGGGGGGGGSSTQSEPELQDLSGLPKQSKQIVLHWTAGGYNAVVGPYHSIFTGDGRKHQQIPYDQKSKGTLYRPDAISLSVAAMAGKEGSYSWPKPAQLDAISQEAANLAKAWGWKPADINVKNVAGHGEVGSGKDVGNLSQNISTGRGESRGPAGSQDNYGPAIWGGDGSRWDLSRIAPGDNYGDGEKKMREMIKSKLASAGKFHGGFISKTGIEKVHGKEYIIDADSVSLFGKDFFEKINQIENRPQMSMEIPSLISTLKNIAEVSKKPRDDGEPEGPKDASIKGIKPSTTLLPQNKTTNVSESGGVLPDPPSLSKAFDKDTLKNVPDMFTMSGLENLPSVGVSKELVEWAKKNKSMIEKVGTKKQKEILVKVELQERIQKLYSSPDKSEPKKEQPVEKMMAGGQVSEIKSSVSKINKFASYNQPSSGGKTVYVQPYVIEKPVGHSPKTMGFSYVGNIDQAVNDRISSLLRN